jgi:hypothetical protein
MLDFLFVSLKLLNAKRCFVFSPEGHPCHSVALLSKKVLLCGHGVLMMVSNLKTIFQVQLRVRFYSHSFIDHFPPVTLMPPLSTFSDKNIDPLVLEDEMCTRDLNSDDTSFSEHGGTSGSTTSQYGEDDVEQDEDLVGHTNTDSTACTIMD